MRSEERSPRDELEIDIHSALNGTVECLLTADRDLFVVEDIPEIENAAQRLSALAASLHLQNRKATILKSYTDSCAENNGGDELGPDECLVYGLMEECLEALPDATPEEVESYVEENICVARRVLESIYASPEALARATRNFEKIREAI